MGKEKPAGFSPGTRLFSPTAPEDGADITLTAQDYPSYQFRHHRAFCALALSRFGEPSMHQTDKTPARERKLARRSTDHINRAVADVLLALDGLEVHEQLIALHEATNDRLGKPHKLVYVTAG